ncbi:MAG: thioredoxin family protein [Vibrionaceae bacterium]
MKKNLYATLIIFVSGLFVNVAQAMESLKGVAFTQLLWQEAQRQDQLTLVMVHANWCPTCKAQHRIINAYFTDNPDSPIKQLIVNFDTQKRWVTYFKAPRQSTLLLYKGNEQIWFSVAETRSERIVNAFKDAERAI